MQVFFGFQTFLAGSTILKGNEIKDIHAQLGEWGMLLPLIAFLIGFSLYVVFFRYHIYLYGYKAWIKNLENSLRNLIFFTNGITKDCKYTGTYYFDSNKPTIKLEIVEAFTLIAMGTLNIGITCLLFHLFNTTNIAWTWVLACGLIFHVITPPILYYLILCQEQKKK